MLDLSLVVIYKGLEISKVFTEEYLKFVSSEQDRTVYILVLLILLLAKADLVLKKRYKKKNLVNTLSSCSVKVVLTLLTKVVVFYMRFFIIYIWEVSFQRFVLGLFQSNGNPNLQNRLENLL